MTPSDNVIRDLDLSRNRWNRWQWKYIQCPSLVSLFCIYLVWHYLKKKRIWH